MTRSDGMQVVVGAASGIGASLAERLAAHGPLLLADSDVDRLTAVADELGGDVRSVKCDITSAEDIESLVAMAGSPACVAVTAGLSPTMASGRVIHDVNLVGLERLIRAVGPAMGAGSAGVVVASIAGHMVPADERIDAILADPLSPSFFDDLSAHGLDPDDPEIAYAVSKRGVLSLVRRHAPAWGTRGARLVSVSPGIIDTGMGRQEAQAQPMMADMVESSALGRIGRPEEVASVLEFLVSSSASYITGTDILVDGGTVTWTP